MPLECFRTQKMIHHMIHQPLSLLHQTHTYNRYLNDTHPSTPEHAGDRLSLTNAEMGILAQACRTLQFSSRFFISLLAKNIDPTFHLQYFIRRTCENTPDIITLHFW